VTVYRFLPGVVDEEEFMFMADLHARMVVTGQVEYAERRRRGREMVGSVVETYSLIILGRSSGGRSHDARHAHADAEAHIVGSGPSRGSGCLHVGLIGATGEGCLPPHMTV
jgi:hypothetical protein